jgi:hypothetical protein
MMDYAELNPMVVELLEIIIEKQRIELTSLVEENDYNFQNIEVIAASVEMDHWLNFYQQSCYKKQGMQKE